MRFCSREQATGALLALRELAPKLFDFPGSLQPRAVEHGWFTAAALEPGASPGTAGPATTTTKGATQMDNIPRRARLYLNTPTELQIREAIRTVEALGGHPLLTETVVLLGNAKDKLADWVDAGRPGENPGTGSAGTKGEP
jgi:hypothetical protein